MPRGQVWPFAYAMGMLQRYKMKQVKLYRDRYGRLVAIYEDGKRTITLIEKEKG